MIEMIEGPRKLTKAEKQRLRERAHRVMALETGYSETVTSQASEKQHTCTVNMIEKPRKLTKAEKQRLRERAHHVMAEARAPPEVVFPPEVEAEEAVTNQASDEKEDDEIITKEEIEDFMRLAHYYDIVKIQSMARRWNAQRNFQVLKEVKLQELDTNEWEEVSMQELVTTESDLRLLFLVFGLFLFAFPGALDHVAALGRFWLGFLLWMYTILSSWCELAYKFVITEAGWIHEELHTRVANFSHVLYEWEMYEIVRTEADLGWIHEELHSCAANVSRVLYESEIYEFVCTEAGWILEELHSRVANVSRVLYESEIYEFVSTQAVWGCQELYSHAANLCHVLYESEIYDCGNFFNVV